MMGARLVSISYTPAGIERKPADRYARVAFDRATLVADSGIEGDRKARSGRRQMNVLRAEVVRELTGEGFRTGPGELGEQLVAPREKMAALGRARRTIFRTRRCPHADRQNRDREPQCRPRLGAQRSG